MIRCAWFCGLLLFGDAVAAQGPLTIEQLLMDASRWQLVSAVGLHTSGPDGGAGHRTTDWSAALRYGVSSRFEVSGRARGQILSPAPGSSEHRIRQEQFSLGVNWLAHREGRLPALLLEIAGEFSTVPDGGLADVSGLHWAATSYRTIDPLVLSLTLSGRHARSFRRDGIPVSPGDSYAAAVRINFAVNPQVTLFGGVDVESRTTAQVNGRRVAAPRNAVGLSGGVAWAPTNSHSFFIDAGVAPSRQSAGLTLRWFYQF